MRREIERRRRSEYSGYERRGSKEQESAWEKAQKIPQDWPLTEIFKNNLAERLKWRFYDHESHEYVIRNVVTLYELIEILRCNEGAFCYLDYASIQSISHALRELGIPNTCKANLGLISIDLVFRARFRDATQNKKLP